MVYGQENYFPLEVGNYWQFKGTYFFSEQDPVVFYDFMKVLGETELGTPGRSFKIVKSFTFPPYYFDTYQFLSFDSTFNSIIEYAVFDDTTRILFDFNAELYECWWAAAQICYFGLDTVEIFDENRLNKLYFGGNIPNFSYYLTDGLGPTKIIDDQSWGITNYTVYELVYAKINGIEYGQLVSVSEEHPELPTAFYLSQNHPNPFNPSTKISWQTPVSGWQTLKVYDVLGNEVATLVNEFRPAGSYEVEFNPGSCIKHLPAGRQGPASGIYFYRLQAGDFVETKKMILLK